MISKLSPVPKENNDIYHLRASKGLELLVQAFK